MIQFNKDLSWLKESDDENLLADDELDTIDEGLYVDPENYGNYDDLVDVVDREGNAQKMTRHTYDANKDSGEFKDAPREEKPSTQSDTKTQLSPEFSDKVKKVMRSTYGRPGYFDVLEIIDTEPALGNMSSDEFKKTLNTTGLDARLSDEDIEKAQRYAERKHNQQTRELLQKYGHDELL